MATRYYSNSASTTLATAVSNVATTIQVASVNGFPILYPFTVIIDRGTPAEEVALVTGASGTSLTVTRGYDSTPNFSHTVGATVEQGITALDAREANQHINANSNVHGVGTIVGTTETQTVTGKTLSAVGNTINGLGANVVPVTDGSGRLVPGTKVQPAGAFVGTTDVQTLTGKTLTAPRVDVLQDTSGNTVLDASTVGPVKLNGLKLLGGADYDIFAAYVGTFTPAIVGVTSTLGHYRYHIQGKKCTVHFAFTATSGTSSTVVTMSLPFAAHGSYVARQALGMAGSSAMGPSVVQLETSTTVSFANSSGQTLGNPATFNINTIAAGSFIYEVA